MEESEKRRERLKAIRVGAAQAEVSAVVGTSSTPGFLSNPLIETSGTRPVQNESRAAPRFDFYTDPMSAFSGNKRNKLPQDQFVSPRLKSPQMNPPYTHQFLGNCSPNQAVHHAESPRHPSVSHMTPQRMENLFPMHQGTPGPWSSCAGLTSPTFRPDSTMIGKTPTPDFGRVGSLDFSSPQARGLMYNGPNTSLGWGGSPNPGRGSPSPYFGRGSPNPYTGGGSPNPYMGRGGRGYPFGNSCSPNLGRGGPKGRRHHAHVTAVDKPELFYDKSMMEDPWKDLTPVIWSSLTHDSWIPKSISMKKARVVEARNELSSQQSLAEYLAASFSEAIDDASSA